MHLAERRAPAILRHVQIERSGCGTGTLPGEHHPAQIAARLRDELLIGRTLGLHRKDGSRVAESAELRGELARIRPHIEDSRYTEPAEVVCEEPLGARRPGKLRV